jgi:hypothetical protein
MSVVTSLEEDPYLRTDKSFIKFFRETWWNNFIFTSGQDNHRNINSRGSADWGHVVEVEVVGCEDGVPQIMNCWSHKQGWYTNTRGGVFICQSLHGGEG